MSGPHLEPARLAALASGDAPADDEAEHLLECRACRGAVSPAPELDAALAEEERSAPRADERTIARLRASAAATRARRTIVRVAGVGAALAAAAALVWVAGQRPNAAAVMAEPGATVTRAREGGDEVVSLEGAAKFDVAPLPAGRRFRVRAAADVLEVKGTSFRVDATPTGFTSVAVDSGVVEVAPACCARVTLRAGDVWDRRAATSATASLDAPTASARATPDAPPTASATTDGTSAVQAAGAEAAPTAAEPGARIAGPSAAELLSQGTAAYDAGRFGAASGLLGRALAAEPSASWARDARVLAGAAQVLSSPAATIPSLAVSVASFDAAAQKATLLGDGARAKAAAVGAARRSSGDAAKRRWCALAADASLPAAARDEATRGCARR